MERRMSALTPENYTRAIISLSRRYSSTSVFPGNNYVDLGEWMRQERIIPNSGKLEEECTLFASKSERSHDLVVMYNSGERKWDVHPYTQDQLEDFTIAPNPPVDSGQIVFLRGFLSPLWVAATGSKYNIDPEFFRRHMDFLSPSVDRHLYSLPSLTNCANNIFRLCVSTILHRDDFGGQNIQWQRLYQATELATYKVQQLGSTRVCCGDSLVREYSTVCSSFSVIEQWISLCVTKTGKGWTGRARRLYWMEDKHVMLTEAVITWMDHGRPLEQSPPGPWTRHIESKATPLPVLQHYPKMAFRTTTNRLNPTANAEAEVQQSTSILPLQYDSLIAMVDLARRAPRDPLSMCIPLFAHAAFSEVQFLNLMESRINLQINTITQGVPADALETLQYFYNILNRHAQQLKDSIHALHKLADRSNKGIDDPKGPVPLGPGRGRRRQTAETETGRTVGSDTSDSPFTPKGILEDYEQLHARCLELSKMCTWGITLAMNKATIEESRKAIEQSARLKKLTLLATLFIPLTFSSSLLGMNIDLLGQNAVKYWWFFVLCVPTTVAASLFYFWDTRLLRRCWASFWKWPRIWQMGLASGRHEKDPGHLV